MRASVSGRAARPLYSHRCRARPGRVRCAALRARVPGGVELAQRRWRLDPVEEGIQLRQVHAVVLRIDVPAERLAGPQGAYEGVFAAHQVEVARPEQPVVLRLRHQRQPVDGQRPRVESAVEDASHGCGGPAGRDQQSRRLVILRQPREQRWQSRRLVAEQAHQPFATPSDALLLQPGRAVGGAFRLEQAWFAQQAACRLRESGMEEMLGTARGRAAEDR